MASFKAKDGTGWKDASAIYGKNASGWQYAKEAFAKTADGWQRVWTDCRQLSAGGRDWTTSTTCAECSETITDYSACDSCGSRTGTRTRTRYTKTGCPTYYSDWSAYSYGGCSGSWNAYSDAVNYVVEIDGVSYLWTGTAGYWAEIFSSCKSCPTDCTARKDVYITQCSVTSAFRVTFLACNCFTWPGGLPC